MASVREPEERRRFARQLGEAVRRACLEAALAGHEAASISGLCAEGAFEAALSEIQRLDVGALAEASEAEPDEAPLAAGGAAAGTGALAAGLLEGSARLAAAAGPGAFRKRARSIASRASVLRATLGAALRSSAADAEAVLEIAARCAQVTTLAAEVASANAAAGRDAEAARNLAASAAACALALAEDALRATAESDATRSALRRVWRTRLLLNRAHPPPREGEAG